MISSRFKSTFNQIHNVKNEHQGDRKKVLCVCSAGLLRSPTVAHLLNQKYGYNTRACGTDISYALIPISEALIYWADEIVCVDPFEKEDVPKLEKEINRLFRSNAFNINARRRAEEERLEKFKALQEVPTICDPNEP